MREVPCMPAGGEKAEGGRSPMVCKTLWLGSVGLESLGMVGSSLKNLPKVSWVSLLWFGGGSLGLMIAGLRLDPVLGLVAVP